MFEHQIAAEGGLSWCDPCAAEPLSRTELADLGAFWMGEPAPPPTAPTAIAPSPTPVIVTRLHVRYDRDHFPEDLALQETADRENFQGRFVLRHPYSGGASCEAAEAYRRNLPRQFERQAQSLAQLTGWDMTAIRTKMTATGQALP